MSVQSSRRGVRFWSRLSSSPARMDGRVPARHQRHTAAPGFDPRSPPAAARGDGSRIGSRRLCGGDQTEPKVEGKPHHEAISRRQAAAPYLEGDDVDATHEPRWGDGLVVPPGGRLERLGKGR
jgi:hypothetical protein